MDRKEQHRTRLHTNECFLAQSYRMSLWTTQKVCDIKFGLQITQGTSASNSQVYSLAE